jgi:hypothetical protein
MMNYLPVTDGREGQRLSVQIHSWPLISISKTGLGKNETTAKISQGIQICQAKLSNNETSVNNTIKIQPQRRLKTLPAWLA